MCASRRACRAFFASFASLAMFSFGYRVIGAASSFSTAMNKSDLPALLIFGDERVAVRLLEILRPLGDVIVEGQIVQVRISYDRPISMAWASSSRNGSFQGHGSSSIRLPCLPAQNGQNGQSSPTGKSGPSSCGQPIFRSVAATDFTRCRPMNS